MKIAIIGGGIIGLCSAYYLRKMGHEIVVVDKGAMNDGCSYGNAGMIVPSHFVPLAQPGMIAKGLKWMFDSSSPFYIRPRLSLELMKWGMDFYRHATHGHVNNYARPLLDLSVFSKDLYQDLANEIGDFGMEYKGLLVLYQTPKIQEEEEMVAEKAKQLGLEVEILDEEQINKLSPDVQVNSIGGVYYQSDAHLDPGLLMLRLKQFLVSKGVSFITNFDVNDFEMAGESIVGIKSKNEKMKADFIVLAAGAWTSLLAKKMGIGLQLLAGKGYSFSIPMTDKMPQIPTILSEGKVALTPMGTQWRCAGTMEITTPNDWYIRPNRVAGIVDTINRFYPNLKMDSPKMQQIWVGHRPCSSSGRPIISKTKNFNNLVVATGHGMMGVSMGAGTGKLVADLVSRDNTAMDISPFRI